MTIFLSACGGFVAGVVSVFGVVAYATRGMWVWR